MSAALECIDCGTTTGVEFRYPGYGHKSWPRCKTCGDARLEREEGNRRRNLGPEPADFDPLDAGECWGDEDY